MRTSSLVYTSRSTRPVTMKVLQQLTEHASRKNALVGITGLLLYGSGNYLQVLEGNQASIKILYERIRKDKRHTAVELLCQHERESRLFPDWNMGQLNLDNPDMGAKSDWELISATLARSGSIDWQPADPVIAWVREFMQHNRSETSAVA